MREEKRPEALIRRPIHPPTGEVRELLRRPPAAKKNTPPEQTNAEQFYYSKQMQAKTHMIVVLTDGEQLEGIIEWYDRDCLKLNRENGPNLMLYKHCIKYLYKAEPE
ncbi:MAG: RNA chaperone Hfq [Acidobacteriaceae bacterium]|nr:RNA chaperone Hfq [Acidobacteriaceae bacterium]MBV9778719.1 RNA chaperone Hfq [Acidobacteriaceae bacterium]